MGAAQVRSERRVAVVCGVTSAGLLLLALADRGWATWLGGVLTGLGALGIVLLAGMDLRRPRP